MNADQVRAIVAKQFPQAINSPLAQTFGAVAARDEACAAIDFAGLSAKVEVRATKQERNDALEHALYCIEICKAQGIDYDEETISHNVESNFPDLSLHACDEIARQSIEIEAAS